MTLKELIEHLQTLPEDTRVGRRDPQFGTWMEIAKDDIRVDDINWPSPNETEAVVTLGYE